MSQPRDYEHALRIINGRKRRARPKPSSTADTTQRPEQTNLASGTPDLRGTPSIVGMVEWLQCLGHTEQDLNRLNVIHIAGTKGKGSTCAFSESILRTHGRRTGFPRKTGLYTSPHLIRPEERIRIDAVPLAPAAFAKYFFELYDALPQLHTDYNATKSVVERGPRLLQLYALLAFHVFLREKVDVTILETHNGGEYDATNIVPRPLVAAVTTLGMDHIDMLGPTIENIAWHKAGIYKSGSTALSTMQIPSAAKVLQDRALAKGESLRIVQIDERLPADAIQVQPEVQKKNASLAIAIADAFLNNTPDGSAPRSPLTAEDIDAGVRAFAWPGRFQIVPDNRSTWFLDAAHNDMSVSIAAQWFAETVHAMISSKTLHTNVLIFSHINELRDAVKLLSRLATALRDTDAGIGHVVFTTYDEASSHNARHSGAGETKRNALSAALEETWARLLPDARIWHENTVSDAMNRAVSVGGDDGHTHVLITGSQHLVGPALHILESRGVKTA